MKRVAIYAVLGVLLSSAPAFAGKNGLAVGAGLGISTGKGGLVGSLLGGKTNAVAAVEASTGKGGLNVGGVVNATTGKGGILGGLIGGILGGGKGGSGGGCGCY